LRQTLRAGNLTIAATAAAFKAAAAARSAALNCRRRRRATKFREFNVGLRIFPAI